MSATCRSCGAPVIWAIHETTGRRMPFDAEPDVKGKWAMDEDPSTGPHLLPSDRRTAQHPLHQPFRDMPERRPAPQARRDHRG